MLLVFFVLALTCAVFWWYKYRWNIPLLHPSATPTPSTQASLYTLAITTSASQMNASNDYGSGVELTFELRDANGGKVRAEGSRIVILSSDAAASSFESGDTVTINDGDYGASTRYKSTKAGVSTITAVVGDIKPATARILTIAGHASGLSPISLRGSADIHELKSQMEYSFEASVVDSFGNVVESPSLVNWQVLSDPTVYPVKTDVKGKSIFNYVFGGDQSRSEIIRASAGSGHQDYPVTIVQ